MSGTLRIVATRGDLVESAHRVSVAVAGAGALGRSGAGLVAAAGDSELVTFWRSAAKPFQALPLVEDGVLSRFGLGSEELALACASHSSEQVHLDLTDRFLSKIGCTEADLACGPHTPLGGSVAERVSREGLQPTPRWSNCSGKHSGMLALAKHHGWETRGYEAVGHPVQERILRGVQEWTGSVFASAPSPSPLPLSGEGGLLLGEGFSRWMDALRSASVCRSQEWPAPMPPSVTVQRRPSPRSVMRCSPTRS